MNAVVEWLNSGIVVGFIVFFFSMVVTTPIWSAYVLASPDAPVKLTTSRKIWLTIAIVGVIAFNIILTKLLVS